MSTVVRRYADHTVIDAITPRPSGVEDILRGVPGFVAYYAVRTGTGGLAITVCQDQAGTSESTRRAAEWV